MALVRDGRIKPRHAVISNRDERHLDYSFLADLEAPQIGADEL